MRSYIGRADHSGLSDFVAEDAIPPDSLRDFLVSRSVRPATFFWAVIDEDAAEEIRRELASERPGAACVTLLNRAVELIPLRPDVREPSAQPCPLLACLSR